MKKTIWTDDDILELTSNVAYCSQLREFLEWGDVNVNEKLYWAWSEHPTSLLASAIEHRNEPTALMLLELGANPATFVTTCEMDSDGYSETSSPMALAISENCENVVCALLDAGIMLESRCWIRTFQDEEEVYNVLEYAFLCAPYLMVEMLLSRKYTPSEFLRVYLQWHKYYIDDDDDDHDEHDEDCNRVQKCRSILTRGIAHSETLEAAWCTTWVTYSVVRGPWRHLCPMIVDAMVVGIDGGKGEKESVSKKIKK